MPANVQLSGDANADQINAAANLVRAYSQQDSWLGSTAMWVFFMLAMLLAFRCNDVTLWDLNARECPKAPAESSP